MASGRMKTFLLVMSFVVIFTKQTHAFATGPPPSTCLTMFPKHDGQHEQSGQSPFKIKTSVNSYTVGQQIEIEVAANDSRGFVGLQIRVQRTSGDTEKIIGTFSEAKPEAKLKYMTCFGAKNSMVSHKNNDTITNATMIWTAPSESVGDVIITATVVKDFNTWWYGITSVIKGPSPETDPLIMPEQDDLEPIKWYTCGSEKGCFLYPQTCSGDDCKAAVAFKKCGEDYKFEMMYSGEGYISLGLSSDKKMGDDETVTCTSKGNKMTIQHGFNPFLFNERLLTLSTLRGMKMKTVDGKIICQFIRPASLSWHSATTVANYTRSMEDPYYLFLAWGQLKGNDVIYYHSDIPPISNSRISLNDHSIHRGSSLHLFVKIHAVLMMVAWVFFAGIAIMISRFYKDALPMKTICKIGAWFQVHRGVATLVWATTAAGFIIIFIHVDGLTQNEKVTNHAYIGIAVMAAVTLQLIAGIARPGKDSKIRPVFNWGHLFLGTASHILSAANIILAFQLPWISAEQMEFGFIVFFVWIGAQILWEIIFRISDCRNKGSNVEIMDSGTPGKFNIQEEKQEQKSTFKTVMLVLYIISMAAILAAGIACIFLY